MTVTAIYRASVGIPEDVWHHLGHTSTYDRAVLAATKGAVASGQNSYSDVEEWAEFHTIEAARCCERNLNRMIEDFREKLK